MPAPESIPTRSVYRLNFEDPALQGLQDLLVGAINSFMRETAGGLNKLDRFVLVPKQATSTGVAGDYAADASHLYICTATNTWRRVAISTW